MSTEKIRYQIRFTGAVQGVGFRYTSRHIASLLGLTGWVYNEYDGSVIMQVQGLPSTKDQLLSMLYGDRFIRIDSAEKKIIPIEEHEGCFEIKDY